MKITRLNINGQWLEYEDESDEPIRYIPISEEEARKIFRKAKELLDEAGIIFSVACGSLLGAIRDNGHVAKGDQDVDLFTWEEEKLRNNLIHFYNSGLKVTRIYPGRHYAFRLNMNCFIDIYIVRELKGLINLPWRFYALSIGWGEIPRKLLTGWSWTEFLGEECRCPENPEKLLEFWYGSDWRIPQNKKGHYHIDSLLFYWKCCRFISYPLRTMIKGLKFILSSQYRHKILERKKLTGSFFHHKG